MTGTFGVRREVVHERIGAGERCRVGVDERDVGSVVAGFKRSRSDGAALKDPLVVVGPRAVLAVADHDVGRARGGILWWSP